MISALLFVLPAMAWAAPLVVLDSGHQPSQQGAKGQCGKWEYQYNDEVVSALAGNLEDFDVRLTRSAGQEIARADEDRTELPLPPALEDWNKHWILWGRPAMANRLRSDVFLSVHHDSTNDRYIEALPDGCGGKGGFGLNQAFRSEGLVAGYGIFIYDDREQNPARYEASLRLARLIGFELKNALGRRYSTFHQNKNDCRECILLDADLGVYYKNLAVTRLTKMPAVLLEVGTIVDSDDERAVNNDPFRRSFGKAVARALKAFFSAESHSSVPSGQLQIGDSASRK